MSMLADDHVIAARLRAVYDALVQAGPDHFDMSDWYQNGPMSDRDEATTILEWLTLHDASVMTPCGTTACLAGWAAVTASAGSITSSVEAAEYLGMHVDHHFNMRAWFYVEQWPEFALQSLRRKKQRGLRQSVAEHQVVVDMLSDLIAGRRANWWDAGEQDAQSA